MKFCHTVWSTSWVLNTKGMKISQRKTEMMKKTKMNSNKHQRLKSQNPKEKTTKHQQLEDNKNPNKSPNVRTNETPPIHDPNLFIRKNIHASTSYKPTYKTHQNTTILHNLTYIHITLSL